MNTLKVKQFGVIALLSFAILVTMTGLVYADQGVPPVPGNQGITTQTVRIVDGLVMERNLAWQVSNLSLGDIPPLDENQVAYTTAYDADIVAQGGQTTLVKTMAVDTRNTAISQSNVKADTTVTFVATADGGNLAGSENLMTDGAADLTEDAAGSILCPFAADTDGIIPAYCNIVQAGSRYDLTVGSVATAANTRFIGTDATNPVVLNYNINVKPYGTSQGQIPAVGAAMAYVKAHIQEARGYDEELPDSGLMQKSGDLSYSETSSAQGTITAFNKVIQLFLTGYFTGSGTHNRTGTGTIELPKICTKGEHCITVREVTFRLTGHSDNPDFSRKILLKFTCFRQDGILRSYLNKKEDLSRSRCESFHKGGWWIPLSYLEVLI